MRQNSLLVCYAALALSIRCVSADTDSYTNPLGWKAGWFPADTSKTDILATNGLIQLAKFEQSNPPAPCNLATAAVRREWYATKNSIGLNITNWSIRSTLLPLERKAYSDAVLCLQSKPSRLAAINATIAPGAKTLYDDYVAVHINQTFTIHATVCSPLQRCWRRTVADIIPGQLPLMASPLHLDL